jgi:salicylate hydroxylase
VARSHPVIIAGAGIGGLTASLALAAKGFRVIVLEKAERLEEAGAGLQLSPNASRILIGLGLAPMLSSQLTVPEAVSITSARAGREIGTVSLGEQATGHYGAPYWIVHRADLQSALLARVAAHPEIELRLGAAFDAVAGHRDDVSVTSGKDSTRCQDKALALIGADGVWSAVRHQLFPRKQARFTGRIAWRGTLEAGHLPDDFDLHRVQLWLGPNAHLVAYPMSGGQRVNIVAISSGSWNSPGWNEVADATEIRRQFGSPQWPSSVRLLVDAVESWRRWALFAVDASQPWTSGRVALLGDAAHAMLPFVAQGAGMAIEDAAVLAECLARHPNDIPAALARYGEARQPRVVRVQRTAQRTGEIYHMRGAMALARDTVIRLLSGERLRARQDWIYDWRIT